MSIGILRSSFGVAFATLASRILGLVRVMLEARVLGGGSVAGAWFLAFAIPNLFRRLLGEGALGTALIPVITETEVKSGTEQMRRALGVVFSVLGCLLALITLVFSGGAALLLKVAPSSSIALLHTERIQLMLGLLVFLMPYAFFICLVGVIGAVLNTCKQFVLPALGALLLNIFLIGGLAWGYWHHLQDVRSFLPVLVWLVLISGAVQLLLMLLLLRKYDRLPIFSRDMFRNTKVLKELGKLVAPGLIGGFALQISFMVDRFLAISLGPQAVPALTNVDRIVDLPIGIFAISLGSVLMAGVSRSAANGDTQEIGESLLFCLRHVLFISVPIAAGMLFFWRPALTILCLGGNYTADDLEATKQVAMFYGSGIPLFCTLKVILPAYYARKQMKLPLYSSLAAIAVNIVLNLLLMIPLKQGGIALATVLSSLLNNAILLYFLGRQGIALNWKVLAALLLRSGGIALTAGWGLFLLYPVLRESLSFRYVGEFPAFAVLCLLFAGVYLIGNGLCRAPEINELRTLLRRKGK